MIIELQVKNIMTAADTEKMKKKGILQEKYDIGFMWIWRERRGFRYWNQLNFTPVNLEEVQKKVVVVLSIGLGGSSTTFDPKVSWLFLSSAFSGFWIQSVIFDDLDWEGSYECEMTELLGLGKNDWSNIGRRHVPM